MGSLFAPSNTLEPRCDAVFVPFGISALVLGLAAFEIVDGFVVVSDSALDALDHCGLLSSHVSHGSISLDALGDA